MCKLFLNNFTKMCISHNLRHKLCDAKQTRQVKEVITVVEKELGFGEGKLLHKLCKVIMFLVPL